MPVAQKLDEALKKKDTAALQAAIAEGQAAATTNDDKNYLGFYTLPAGIMNKDQALQAQGLDPALASGRVPATDAAVYTFYSGLFAYQDKDTAQPSQRMSRVGATRWPGGQDA